MIVSICATGDGWYEVWVSLPRSEERLSLGESPKDIEQLVTKLLWRGQSVEDAIDLVAGVLVTWR